MLTCLQRFRFVCKKDTEKVLIIITDMDVGNPLTGSGHTCEPGPNTPFNARSRREHGGI